MAVKGCLFEEGFAFINYLMTQKVWQEATVEETNEMLAAEGMGDETISYLISL